MEREREEREERGEERRGEEDKKLKGAACY